MNQTIQILTTQPIIPKTAGALRKATEIDVDLLLVWLKEFSTEAIPDDPPPERREAERRIANGRAFLWCVNGQAVSLSCIGRVYKSGIAIAPVYTPPAQRCKGFAGAATAHLVAQQFAEGAQYACMYTDDSNPASNRCYAKIGFEPYCRSAVYRK